MFKLLQLTWIVGVLYAAPFWVGMYWRKATTLAAWCTVAFCALMFFVIPFLAPRLVPSLRTNENFLTANQIVETTTIREAAPSDVAARNASIEAWEKLQKEHLGIEDAGERESKLKKLGDRPQPLKIGDKEENKSRTGGLSVFWSGGVKEDLGVIVAALRIGNILENVKPEQVGEAKKIDDKTTQIVLAYDDDVKLVGVGNFRLDFLLYQLVGIDLSKLSNAWLKTLELPAKIVSPFLVMILVSLFTRRNSKETLDRYYAKMKTPVDPDPELDHKNLEAAYADPGQFESKKLFPGTSLEFSKPTRTDIVGFVVCFLACFGIIGLAVLVASIGG